MENSDLSRNTGCHGNKVWFRSTTVIVVEVQDVNHYNSENQNELLSKL